MNVFLKVLLGNLLLNKGPQDFPYSMVLMKFCLVVYFLTGLPGLLVSTSFEQAIFAMALDVVVLLLFVNLCLRAFSKSERYVQSITALASIGIVFQLSVLPLLYKLNLNPEAAAEMVSLPVLFLIFFSWNLAVYTHIFRESFGVRLPAAMILTVCYVVIYVLARKLIFPELE